MTAKKHTGSSGKPLTHQQQLARGRIRLVVVLDATDARCLDELAEGSSRAEATRQAIRDAYERR